MSLFRDLGRKIRGPRCHLDPEEKAWVERRMTWLREQFGPEPIRRAPLDPTSDILPKKWDSSRDAGADLFNRLSRFMLVDSEKLKLHFYSKEETHKTDSAYAGEQHSSGPAGLYHDPKDSRLLVIALEESGLKQPASLAATICHELGHVHLLGEKRIKRDEEDCEPLTDLLTVYFGAGILTANTAFQFNQWQDHRYHGWSASRQGYLSEALFGYSLACYSWYRGDARVDWRKHLRENIRYYFDDSMHFLSATRDCVVPFGGT
jgi:hypothetical protein